MACKKLKNLDTAMLEPHLNSLHNWFGKHTGVVVAFSGGIDSTLALFLAHKTLGKNTLGCISISPSLKRKDYQFAIEFCDKHAIALQAVETRELYDTNYVNNPPNRCYHCKNHLYDTLSSIATDYPDWTLVNGINMDDLGDYRPGINAAKEHGIRSPFVECRVNKTLIRRVAQYYALPNWNKPASPCLSSRIPYHKQITLRKLNQIEQAENWLNKKGYSQVRVRHLDEKASIEVPLDAVPALKNDFDNVEREIKKLGFKECLIDEEGLISGKLNRALKKHV